MVSAEWMENRIVHVLLFLFLLLYPIPSCRFYLFLVENGTDIQFLSDVITQLHIKSIFGYSFPLLWFHPFLKLLLWYRPLLKQYLNYLMQYVKCGFAGENFPTSVFPCVVGRPMLRYEESLMEQELKVKLYFLNVKLS